ncbi:hypothetical protein L227DRAFT_601692 [Lentinus tigrinus ALCF2SS1-6]|uniref:DUF6533 domain-containing protein n=1 Tax=Lentinus tigrinus ALCF2SS1-6 TaxID=1328759 RepID=A0A5C2S5T4_9APHY|nr:hypothetical protein L227DRAFT_601692 [Lentinus tigrinus ALCF2SS1-6]
MAASNPHSDADVIVALFSLLYNQDYCITASAVLFIYDTIVTFDREVGCFWNSKTSGAALLFFTNKYLTVATFVFSFVAFNGSIFTDQALVHFTICASFQQAGNVVILLQMLPSAAFSTLRAYVLSKSKLLGLLVFALSMAPVAANLVPYAYHYSGEILPPLGCLYVDTMNSVLDLSLGSRGALRDIRRSGKLSLPSIFLRDGTVYFLLFGVINILFLVFSVISRVDIHSSGFAYLTIFMNPEHKLTTRTPLQLAPGIPTTARIMSILISRFLLQLQESSQTTLRVPKDDPLHISVNAYDETPSFVRSLGSVINPGIQGREESIEPHLHPLPTGTNEELAGV